MSGHEEIPLWKMKKNKEATLHALCKMMAKTEAGHPDYLAGFQKMLDITKWFHENNIDSFYADFGVNDEKW